MRLVLVILIVLAQVAGPWLCCCAAAQISGAVCGKDAQPGKPLPVKKSETCPHCAKSEPTTPASPSEPPPSRPLPDKCPCGGYELVAVPAERAPAADEVLVLVAELPALPVPFPTVLSPVVAERPGLRELPWMTVTDRLFAHHVLRC